MNPEFFRPTGRSTWTAKELSRLDDWIYQLPQKALDEIDVAVKQLKDSDVDVLSVTREDMPLSSISADLESIREEIATRRGFVIMRGLPSDKYSNDELAKIFWGIGTHFGNAMPQSFMGDRLGDIMDLSDEEPDPRRRRAYHSGGEQETHTDSSDIVAMLSICTAKSGGACRLASAHTVHNLMLDYCPGLLRQFYEGFYVRRANSDAEAAGHPPLSPNRVPIYTHSDGWLNCWYVRGYVQRAIDAGDIEVDPIELAAMKAFEAFSNHPDIRLEMLLQPGDMQFFNNRTVLHGRTEFEDYPEKERRRHLLRLWLAVPKWPAMPAVQQPHSDEDMLNWEANAEKQASPPEALILYPL